MERESVRRLCGEARARGTVVPKDGPRGGVEGEEGGHTGSLLSAVSPADPRDPSGKAL